jgi:hypothetical protein
LPHTEDRQAFVLFRAYAAATEGEHPSFLSIVQMLVSDGYPEAAAWLNQEAVRPTLNTICLGERQRKGVLRSAAFQKTKMLRKEDRLSYAAHRAYALAGSGSYPDFASIQEAIVEEGLAEFLPWFDRVGVVEALSEICVLSRQAMVAP